MSACFAPKMGERWAALNFSALVKSKNLAGKKKPPEFQDGQDWKDVGQSSDGVNFRSRLLSAGLSVKKCKFFMQSQEFNRGSCLSLLEVWLYFETE